MKKLTTSLLLIAVGFSVAYLLFTHTEFGLRNVEPEFYAKKVLVDGGVYQGEIDENGFLSGHGKLAWENGAYYSGSFREGLFDGYGEYYYAKGGHYKGDFVKGIEQGVGELLNVDGSVYTGQFEKGMFHGKGKMVFANGNIYEGDFVESKMEGHGTWILANNLTYKGDVAFDGLYHGKGEIRYENGATYTGDFVKGKKHGQGIYITTEKETYSGDFFEDDFEGKGTFSSDAYGKLVGEFKDWYANGPGFRTDAEGNQWKGNFVNSMFEGEGEYIGIDGTRYEGEFVYGNYEGKGKLVDKEGNIYVGKFMAGTLHGEGEYEYKEAIDGIKKFKGKWRYGKLVEGDDLLKIYTSEEIVEHAIYNQQRLLDKTLEKVVRKDSAEPQLYFLGIAGWGQQEVFHREVNFVEQQFSRMFDIEGKKAILVNSQRSIEDWPLATVTSIRQAILHFADVMDKENDILFIYATSHGSKKSGFSIEHKGLPLEDLSPDVLKSMLVESGIKYKVIVISSCYSGAFIEALQDETSLIITSAAKDKTSFGCSDNRLFTYFGKAFFEEALAKNERFIDAFYNAATLVEKWEKEDNQTSSKPQIYISKGIEAQLEKWRKTSVVKAVENIDKVEEG